MPTKGELGVATMTYKRGASRLGRLLASFDGAIVAVDQNTDDNLVEANRRVCEEHDAEHVHTPRRTFNKCLGLNVGIKHLGTNLIAAVDVDMILPPGFEGYVADKLQEYDLVVPFAMWLPENADYDVPFDELCEQAEEAPGRRKDGLELRAAGPVVAASREWWHSMRGFDEGFEGTLGGMESDLIERARRRFDRICRERVWVLHQWHPRSPLKFKDRYYDRECKGRTETVVNEEWGL